MAHGKLRSLRVEVADGGWLLSKDYAPESKKKDDAYPYEPAKPQVFTDASALLGAIGECLGHTEEAKEERAEGRRGHPLMMRGKPIWEKAAEKKG